MKTNYKVLLLLAFFFCCMGTASAQVEFIKDINSSSENIELRIIEDLTFANNKPLMVYENHPSYGTELWTLNDNEEPVLVMDIVPGVNSSEPYDLIQLGDKVIFSAQWPGKGYLATVSDGTTEGTFSLADFVTGAYANYLTPLGSNEILFLEQDGPIPNRLWKTDGTLAGTSLVATLPEGANNIRNFESALGKVFFQVSTDDFGQELWVTDGTEAGTQMVKDINPGTGGSSPTEMTEFNGEIYFKAYTPDNGNELWKSDGTDAGTVLVKDIQIGTANGLSSFFPHVFEGKLYFSATNVSNNEELWTSDGTDAGTVLVKDIRTSGSSRPTSFFTFNSTLLFKASGDEGTELYKTDGTEEGTVLLKDLKTGTQSGHPENFTLLNNNVYFSAEGDTEEGLWVTDGTTEGTTLASAIDFGNSNGFRNMIAVAGALFIATQQDGPQLFKSDGTAEGTSSISQEVTLFKSSFPRIFMSLNNGVVFVANRTEGERSLWYTDGSEVVEILPTNTTVTLDIDNPDMLLFDGELIFIAENDSEGEELWSTDGTVAGTQLLKDINPGTSSSRIEDLTYYGSRIIFQATDGTTGKEPWISDGTTEGTKLLEDINPGSGDSNPRNYLIQGSKCYFNAYDGSTGIELWVTDGTAVGTNLVVDLNPTGAGSFVNKFLFGDKIVIFGTEDNPTYGYEVVISDGTEAGTQRITDINVGSANTNIGDYVVYEDYFVFSTYINAEGIYQLWKSDGTVEGTEMIATDMTSFVFEGAIGESVIYIAKENGQVDLKSTNTLTGATVVLVSNIPVSIGGEGGLNDRNSVLVGDQLFITDGIFEDADEDAYLQTGSAVWVTDGTLSGTVSLTEDTNGDPVAPLKMIEHQGEVYFTGLSSSTNTSTLWHTDGTVCGTQPLFTENVNVEGNVVAIDGYLYFRGSSADLGSELYRYNLSNEIPNLLMTWYRDADGDGLGTVNDMIEDCKQPEGYVNNADDCDDTDTNVGQFTWYQDADGDGLGNENQAIEACEQPDGYVDNATDCDDTDETVSQYTWYQDADGDGLGNENEITLACEKPDGYVDNTTDCDDTNASIGLPTTWYQDQDGDGLGNLEEILEACNQPAGYVSNSDDCDDADAGNQCVLSAEKLTALKIYPNPSSDYVHIDSEDRVSVKLIDLEGKGIKTYSGTQLKINIQSLQPGVYILRISDGGQTINHRIIKAN